MDNSSAPVVSLAPPPTDIPPPPKPTNKLLLVFGGLVILLIGLSAGFVLVKSASTEKPNVKPTGIACTMEAKICPDGSSVGRSGPNCEFTPCPQSTISQTSPTPTTIQTSTITDPTASWKTYTNTKNGYSLKYPTAFEMVKGPVPESELPTLDNISFSGMGKSSDSNAGVVINISVNPSDANGKRIFCTTNDDCLQKLLGVLNKSSNEVTNNSNILMGKSVKGFEYQNKNSLYIQSNQYFIYPENGKIWQVSININNYSIQEVQRTIDQILSTFKFIENNIELNLTKLYEIKKPDTWKIISSDVDAESYVTKIGIESDTRKPIVTISTFKYEYTSGGHDAPGSLTTSRDIVISGVKTKLDKYIGKGIADQLPLSTLEVIRLLNDKGNYFVIEFSYLNRDELSDKQMDDQFINILSTFKFL